MQRRRASFATFAALSLASAVVATGVSACSGEGEGQRCSTTDDQGDTKSSNGGVSYNSYAGSSDCSGDLWCYPASQLGGLAAQYASQAPAPTNQTLGICCPPPGERTASDPVLICALQVPAGDAAPPVDAAASDALAASDSPPGTDAGEGGAEDALPPATDAATDAPADAAAE